MSFYELKTIVLCQNYDLTNHAANCEIFGKPITLRNISQITVSPKKSRQKFKYRTNRAFKLK